MEKQNPTKEQALTNAYSEAINKHGQELLNKHLVNQKLNDRIQELENEIESLKEELRQSKGE